MGEKRVRYVVLHKLNRMDRRNRKGDIIHN